MVSEFTPALSNALTKKGADVAVEVLVSEQSGADPSVIEVVFTPVTEAGDLFETPGIGRSKCTLFVRA